jgi:hypothetical protein
MTIKARAATVAAAINRRATVSNVVSFRPAASAATPEHFAHVHTYDRLAGLDLVLARSMIDGVPCLSVLLTNLPDEQGFEILATGDECDGTRAALDLIARAVGLAALHLLPEPKA